ncbi:hypothetical protein AOQ84DRAFT_378781 [Glonium stellatum]|uniref:AA1-like domain-containing protein n=1 Tax=Glonium stellatum TaxID=574774 RepID=A0A8E2JQX2_9PEZI|nr:hypothetical protein AOQ84DRAFT_378781 [Glonium stellatum]
MLFATLSTIFLSALALTSPTPNIHPRQAYNITFTVTNFTAFMADPYIEGTQSNLSFHVVDPRPKYYTEVDCVIPPTYFSLYAITALYEYCGNHSLNFMFLFEDGEVSISRGWTDDAGNSFTASGSLNPYWNENGPSANVTVTPTGKLYTRKSAWMFPVNRLQKNG